jgi:uncharacterized membrane protein
MRYVVDGLTAEGTLPQGSDAEIAALYSNEAAALTTPWYIRTLLGLSAWIAAILLLIFLFGMSIINEETGALAVGIVLCTLTIGMHRLAGNNLFLGQLALALSLTGQLLVVGGAGVLSDSVTVGALVMIMLQGLLIALYKDHLHRLLSTLAIIAALAVLVFEWEADLLLHALIILVALGTVVLWKRELELAVARLDEIARPVAYGLTFGLLALVCWQFIDDGAMSYWWLSTLGLMGVLAMQVIWLLREHRVTVDRKLMVGLLVIAVVLTITASTAPGLLAALVVLLIGFRHTNRLLLGTAVVFLAIFLGSFYYMLSLSLLGKSLALIGSGLALLGLRGLARLNQPDEVPL